MAEKRKNKKNHPGMKTFCGLVLLALSLSGCSENKEVDFVKKYKVDLNAVSDVSDVLQKARQKRVAEPVKTEQKTRMGQVMHYIHRHFDENITLESLAERFYVSSYYLCREFKAYTNSTVIQYVNVTRIMNAQRRIMETDKSITEISREMGFSNLTHFNRVFKAVTGMTPSGYRKSHKNLEIYVGGIRKRKGGQDNR